MNDELAHSVTDALDTTGPALEAMGAACAALIAATAVLIAAHPELLERLTRIEVLRVMALTAVGSVITQTMGGNGERLN